MRPLFLLLLLAAGCGSSTTKVEQQGCQFLQGNYVYRAERRSGDCVALQEGILRFNGGGPGAPDPAKNCKWEAHYSGDRCSIDADLLCPDDPSGINTPWSRVVLVLRGVPDGSSATGVMEVTIMDPAMNWLCHSTYGVTYTRV